MEELRTVRAPGDFKNNVLRACGLLDGYAAVESPAGKVYVATSSQGVRAVMQSADDAQFEAAYYERFGRRAERRDELAPELQRLVSGQGAHADVCLDECNDFMCAVLEATRRIPEGTVRPYAWIAREIGRPKAVRAVGTALAKNPLPLVIPCHRVVRSDGTTGEYALGGPAKKVQLLEGERVDLADMRHRVSMRGRLWNFEGQNTFCYPFCFHASEVEGKAPREFATAAEAMRAGLEPCSACHSSLAA